MTAPPASMPPRSVRSPSSVVERLGAAPGSYLASWANIFIQIRHGALTHEAFDRVCATFSLHRTLMPRGSLHGSIILTEPGAPIPPASARTRQRAFITELLKQPNVRMAVIVVGERVDASLLRSVSRGVVPSHPQLRIFGEPDRACAWMAEQMNVDMERIAAVLTDVRALAERERAAG